MANKTFSNIRILIRNDTAENWETSTLALKKGEMALNTTNGEVRIATADGQTFAQAAIIGGEEAEIIRDSHYEGTRENNETDNEVITRVLTAASATAIQGDIFVIKTLIAGDKYSYSSYVYDNDAWNAMDGNVNAENVVFTKDITCAGNYTTVGNISKTNSGTTTITASGKTVADVFASIFTKKLQPQKTEPSVSVSCSQAKAYEVGTKVTPTYTTNFNAGSYTYGPATGVKATGWSVIAKNGTTQVGDTLTTASGSFEEIEVTDTINYKITATATYSAGVNANDNLGGQSDPIVAIAAGSKNATSSAITGYRNSFSGTKTSKDGTINSAYVRGLTTIGKKADGNTFSISVPVGAMRVMFAYPASLGEVASVQDVNGLNAVITSAFTKVEVNVEGANGYTAIPYFVYYTDYANANDKANTYTVKI